MVIKLYKSEVNVSKEQSSVTTAKLEGDFGQGVFRSQQQLLNTTMQIEQRHRSMQEDKDVIEQTTKYNEDLNEIVVNHNKLNNYDEGIMSYETATNELLTNTTANIKNNNVKRRVEEHALRHNSAYKIDIGKNIRTNNTKIFKDSLELKKNESFNTILTSNPALQTQMRDELFIGPNSLYNQELNAGTLEAGVTEETYNQALENDYEKAEAQYLISTNVSEFTKRDKEGAYNNLDNAVYAGLKIAETNAVNSANTAKKTNYTDQKTVLKEATKEILDVNAEGYQFDPEIQNTVLENARNLHELILSDPDKLVSGLEGTIQSLEEIGFVNEYMASENLKNRPTDVVEAYKNSIEEELQKTSGTKNFNPNLIPIKDAIDSILEHRETNKDNLLTWGKSKTEFIEPLNIDEGVIIDDQTALNRKKTALSIAERLDEIPQFFTPQERTEAIKVASSGSKAAIQNLINNVIKVSGPDNAPLAFQELSVDGLDSGVAHIGTLQARNGGDYSRDLDNALDAIVLINNENTKDKFKLFNPKTQISNVDTALAITTKEYLDVYSDNTFSDDITLYNQLYDSAEYIFYGKILSNPSLMNLDSIDEPSDNNDVVKLWKESLNQASGFHNNKGGLGEYNNEQIILPSWMPNTLNPDDTNANLGSLLSDVMTDELFEKATMKEVIDLDENGKETIKLMTNRMVEHLSQNEQETSDASKFIKREIPANEMFGVEEIGLYQIDDGKYIMTWGPPISATEGYTNSEGQLVVLDLNKIKPELIKNLDKEEKRAKVQKKIDNLPNLTLMSISGRN